MQRLTPSVFWAGLVTAVFSLGIMAGYFGTGSGNVNLATLELDGPTYALVQSAFNRHVRHALFFCVLLRATGVLRPALAKAWRQRPGWWWLVVLVGLGYAPGIVVFTRAVNLPLNQITESLTATTLPSDWASTREAWNRANAWRAGCSTMLFALGLAALTWRAAGVRRPQQVSMG